ncbi:MAG: ATP-dependent Clp protease adaptor ClpS [bacterium]|nr:ATP-dependent Clp protease adaptor ClpS [bacterium]
MSPKHDQGPLGHTQTQTEQGLERPRQYKVLLHNDDYTPMEFVVQVLMEIFHKDEMSAMRIMLNVHNHGTGLCGRYSFEIAETKIVKVHEIASQHEYPLRATMEEE